MYIHERKDWPNLIWEAEAIAGILADVRYKQGRLLGRMGELGFALQAEAGISVLTSEVVKSSAIEGETLNPEEVRSSIARRLGFDAAGLPKAGRDVEGIVEVMLDATRNYETPLSDERLFGWHAALFPTGRSGSVRIEVGAWRKGTMQVVSGPMGKENVHFEAPDAPRLPLEMQRFIAWFNKLSVLDPVLRAGLAHFWFVTVHPFDDGNGRIARAIADMALAQADQTRERFYSMSSQIATERKEYYRQLENTQRGDSDITGWMLWFLECLGRAIDHADDILGAVIAKSRAWKRIDKHPVNERQRAVLDRMLTDFQGYMNTTKYAKLAKCSQDTAARDIQALSELGLLERNPGGSSRTSYRLADGLSLPLNK